MNKKIRLLCLLALFAAGALGAQTAVTTASSNGTIREGGPRPNPWFHTAQGPGDFASYAISSFSFTAGDFGVGAVAGIAGATISYTQRNAAFTSDGPVSFHVTFDTIVSGGDYSGLAHAGTGTGLNDTQFSDMPLTQVLGEGTFTEVADGTVDTYVLNFTGALESSLVEAINSGNAFSIILATSDSDAAVTYAGIENNDYPNQIDLSLTVIPATISHTVTFDLGERGTRVGGGELTQTVAQGGAAVAPEVEADAGWTFTGWASAFDNITADTTVAAQYEEVVSDTWAGLPLEEDGTVVTDGFGLILPLENHAFVYRLDAWVYLPETFVTENGAWIFGPGWEALPVDGDGWYEGTPLGMVHMDAAAGFLYIHGAGHWAFPADYVENSGRWLFLFADAEVDVGDE